MTSDEYATLMNFLATRFARIDARLERIEARQEALETRVGALEARVGALEARLTRAEVLRESMRDDLRRVAEGVVALNERLDRGLESIQVRFDRFAVDFGTVQLDHGARIEALERQRRGRGPGG